MNEVRVHTIVWGVILLAGAGLAFVTLVWGAELSGPVVVWIVVATGILLVVAGLVSAAVSAARRGRGHPPVA